MNLPKLVVQDTKAAIIKPCPFCGGTNITWFDPREETHEEGTYITLCCNMTDGGCGASSRISNFSKPEACVRAWNKRIGE